MLSNLYPKPCQCMDCTEVIRLSTRETLSRNLPMVVVDQEELQRLRSEKTKQDIAWVVATLLVVALFATVSIYNLMS